MDKIYKKLVKYESKKQPDFIKNVFWFYSKSNKHRHYNILLKLFIPKVDLELKSAIFEGFGLGAGSLDSFRRIDVNSESYFEKIYFTGCEELNNILWLYDNFYAKLSTQITIPEIKAAFKSDILTVVYFEFLALEGLESDEVEKSLIEVSKLINRIESNRGESETDFTQHFEYARRLPGAVRRLVKNKIDLKELQTQVNSTKKVLTHADLQQTNAFKNKAVTDWDSAGLYPIGFEQAFIYYRLLHDRLRRANENPTDWLDKNFGKWVEENDYAEMKANFHFFLFVFCSRLFKKSRFKKLEQYLIRLLGASKEN